MEADYNILYTKYGDYLTVKELANYLRICDNTVYKLLKTRQIKGRRIGNEWRIPSGNVVKFLNGTV